MYLASSLSADLSKPVLLQTILQQTTLSIYPSYTGLDMSVEETPEIEVSELWSVFNHV
jgi:hypothetical protein